MIHDHLRPITATGTSPWSGPRDSRYSIWPPTGDRKWNVCPCFEDLGRQTFGLALPAVLSSAIAPTTVGHDVRFVRGNQIFLYAFWALPMILLRLTFIAVHGSDVREDKSEIAGRQRDSGGLLYLAARGAFLLPVSLSMICTTILSCAINYSW